MCAWGPVVIRSQGAPGGGAHTEDREEGAGHQVAADPLGASTGADVHVHAVAAEHAGKHRVVVGEVAIHRIGEDEAIAPPAAGVRAAALQQDQLVRGLDRHDAQQHLVDQGEDGGIGADARARSKAPQSS